MPFLSWLHLLEWSTNKWNHSNAYRPPYLVGLLSVELWPVGATFGNIQGYGFVIFVSDIRCVHVCAHGRNVPLLAVTSLSRVLFYSQSAYLLFLFLHFSLGHRRWDKFEDSYRVMVFSNGDKCWNGPDRSLKVLILMLLSWVMFLFSLV